MKEKIRYFAKISSVALFSFIKINLLGFISTFFCFTIGLYLLSASINSGIPNQGLGHGNSGILFIVFCFLARPIGTILLILIFSAPFLYFMLGNKYIISKMITRLIKDKSEDTINPLLEKVLKKVKTNQPQLLKKGADLSLTKIELLNQVKSETDNKWLKKVILFGLKKVKLDDVDFNRDNIDFSTILKTKTINALQNVREPSRKSILLVLTLQFIFLFIIWLFPC